MHRKAYSPEQKAAALVHVQHNGGNIPLTSLQIGIPERTLYTWCRRWYAENQQRQTPPLPSPNPIPTFPGQTEALNYVASRITDELVRLASNLESSSTLMSPYQRVMMLSQLSDRLTKLDQHVRLYGQPQEPLILELADSEGEEPDGDDPDGLIMMLQDGEESPFTVEADVLKNMLASYRQVGRQPHIIVQYWHESDDFENVELEWSGTLTLHEPRVNSEAENASQP